MLIRHTALLAACALGLAACQPAPETAAVAEGPRVIAATDIEAGRYLVLTGGCNDCHTRGYPQSGGNVPESEWLTGTGMGFHGPWGTSYPHNLRLTVAGISEDDWVEMLNTREALPPMPWPSVRAMNDADKRAIYRYIKSLPLAGEPAPTALPPGQIPTTPYENMTPVMPGA